MAQILVIDDDRMLCDMLCRQIGYMKHAADYALSLAEGYEKLRHSTYDVVLLDVRLPDGNGLEALPRIRRTAAGADVIIITGEGDPDGAELAVRNGAWDYLEKPLSPNKILLPLTRVLQYRDSLADSKPVPVVFERGEIIGQSPKILACINSLAQSSGTDANILLTGETGTGKELFAEAAHHNSRRAEKNFVVVDCAALPETLIESSLFGYEKGAFTGADRSQNGLIAQSDKGTLFLDEVGELGMELQKSFLRVLQERRFRPVGGKTEVASDFRLIAATNRNLDRMVEDGRFRKDLLYRLRTIAIELPPLRERVGDIRQLSFHYMISICQRYGIETKGFAPEFLEVLTGYPWPGNVRELVNAMEEALNRAHDEPTLFPQHLPESIRIQFARGAVSAGPKPADTRKAPAETRDKKPVPTYREFRESVMAAVEKRYFQDLIQGAKGNIREACRQSGLGRSRLYAQLKKHGISRMGW